jgi:hypothetical protein
MITSESPFIDRFSKSRQYSQKLKTTGKIKHREAKLIKQEDKEYKEIIDFANKHKTQLLYYKISLQTIIAFGVLEKSCKSNSLQRKNLTRDVYSLTGLAIHAKDNYPSMDVFKKAVALAAENLKSSFSEATTDAEKLRLFNHGLNNGGCFEARVEDLIHYHNEIETKLGLLKYEIIDFNKIRNRPTYEAVPLDEFINFLKESNFYQKYHITEDSFKDDPVIKELQDLDLIQTNDQKPPLEKIFEALSLYTEFGSGLDNFKNHVLETANLTDQEKENFDDLIEQLKEKHPSEFGWI